MLSKIIPSHLKEKVIWSVLNGLEHKFFKNKKSLSNQTSYETVYQDGIMSLRHYLPLKEDEIEIGSQKIPVENKKYKTPILFIPPLAASSLIFDLFPNRSLVRYFTAKGYDVFLIDWGEPTKDHSHLTLEQYVLKWMPEAIEKVKEITQESEITLYAYCMGGIFALMYGAMFPDGGIRNMVTVASPADLHKLGLAGILLSLVYEPTQYLSQKLDLNLMDIHPKFLHVSGKLASFAFKLTNPVGSLMSGLELLLNLWDWEYVEKHRTMSKWYNDMSDYPGALLQEFVAKIGIENQLAKGKMTLAGKEIDFSKITNSILVFAGNKDKIVTIPAAQKILDIISSEDKQFSVVSGGHAGVFAGGKAPEETWAVSEEWLSVRSN
jgi:polyhydroxyalkanoate synthase